MQENKKHFFSGFPFFRVAAAACGRAPRAAAFDIVSARPYPRTMRSNEKSAPRPCEASDGLGVWPKVPSRIRRWVWPGKPVGLEWVLRVLLAAAVIWSPLVFIGYLSYLQASLPLWKVFAAYWAMTSLALLALRCPTWSLLPFMVTSLIYSGYILKQERILDRNDVVVCLNTTPAETWGFVSSGPMRLTVTLATIALVMLLVLMTVRWTTLWKKTRLALLPGLGPRGASGLARTLTLPPAALVALGALVAMGTWVGGLGGTLGICYPFRTLWTIETAVEEVTMVATRYARVDYAYAGPSGEELPETLDVILCIGESARAANWQAYGYADRATTPNVSRRMKQTPSRMLAYYDATASARLTMHAVPTMLSPIPAGEFRTLYDHPSVFRIFNQAGYWTAEISSRVTSPYWTGPVVMFFNECQHTLRYGQMESSPYPCDDGIAASIAEKLSAPQPRKFLTLHVEGSHHDYDERYPEKFSVFSANLGETPSEEKRQSFLATYDNSIRYTDHIVESVMEAMDNRSTPAMLLFCSDHGENFNEHGDGNHYHAWQPWITGQEVYVPFIIYVNKAYAKAYPERLARMQQRICEPISHDNIAHTLLGQAGLTDPQVYREAYDLTATGFTPMPRFVLRRFNEPVSLEDVHKETNTAGTLVGQWPEALRTHWQKKKASLPK